MADDVQDDTAGGAFPYEHELVTTSVGEPCYAFGHRFQDQRAAEDLDCRKCEQRILRPTQYNHCCRCNMYWVCLQCRPSAFSDDYGDSDTTTRDGNDGPSGPQRDGNLYRYIRDGDIAAVQQWISSNVGPEGKQHAGWTPLALAAYDGHADIVALLVQHWPESINVRNAAGATPRMIAAARGHAAVIEILRRASAPATAAPVAPTPPVAPTQPVTTVHVRPKPEPDRTPRGEMWCGRPPPEEQPTAASSPTAPLTTPMQPSVPVTTPQKVVVVKPPTPTGPHDCPRNRSELDQLLCETIGNDELFLQHFKPGKRDACCKLCGGDIEQHRKAPAGGAAKP